MVHWFSQRVCFLFKRRGKNDGKEKGIKRKGLTMEEKIGRKERKKKGKKERNKMLGRALDPRANGTWLSKLAE